MLVIRKSTPPMQHGKAMSVSETSLAKSIESALTDAAAVVKIDVGRAHIRGGADELAAAFTEALVETDGYGEYQAIIEKKALGAATIVFPTRKAAAPTLEGAFNIISPTVTSWSEAQSARFVTSLTVSTRDAVNELVQRSVYGGLTIDQLERQLRNVLPLTKQAAAQIMRAHEAWVTAEIKAGKTLDQAYSSADAMATKLTAAKRRQRSRTVSRTELANAENAGHMTGVAAGVKAGTVAPGTLKEWATAEDELTCPICRPMNGEIVQWNKPFSNGLMCAPAHVNCRCSFNELPPDYENDDMFRPLASEEDLYGETTEAAPLPVGFTAVDLKEIEDMLEQAAAEWASEHVVKTPPVPTHDGGAGK